MFHNQSHHRVYENLWILYRYFWFVVYWFYVPFNIFQVIHVSWQCLLETEIIITIVLCWLTEISHRRLSRMISHPVILYWQRVNQFWRWIILYMSIIWQGNFNYQFEISGFIRPGFEPGASQSRGEWPTNEQW